jgi:hypothetical protein
MSDQSVFDQFLYVVDFEDGVVKVGFTKNKKQRIRVHKLDGRNRDALAQQVMFSDGHTYDDIRRGERALISGCARSWPLAWGAEYFRAPFLDACEVLAEVNAALLVLAGRWDELQAGDRAA